MKITNEYINKCFEEMSIVISGCFNNPEEVEISRGIYEKSKNNINIDIINFCLEKYLHSEFDYETSGDRGLGRMSDYCPRLGAYFRKPISKMNPEKINELDNLITNFIIKSYLFVIFTNLNPLESSDISNELFYEKWVPKIYVFDWGNLSEETTNLLFIIIQKDWEELKNFFKENDMKAGLFGQDKTDEILRGYAASGLMLKAAQKI